jgi:hypothetical protein
MNLVIHQTMFFLASTSKNKNIRITIFQLEMVHIWKARVKCCIFGLHLTDAIVCEISLIPS